MDLWGWFALSISTAYIGVLFAIAWWGDRASARGPLLPAGSRRAAIAYALTLAIYNTSWSFYGSVGRAATSGFDFLPIYIGPTLVLLLGQPVLAKVIAIARAHNATSIADFVATRYGKSRLIAALVTITALIGVLPYIALQLKAVGMSFDVLTAPALSAPPSDVPFWQDTAFAVALAMAVFTIIFGVRHIHAAEHHRGLMLAIAFESVVKLAAFLAVAIFIVYGMFDGVGALFARAAASPDLHRLVTINATDPTWITNTIISIVAFVCLPQAFHVMVVENENAGHTRSAAWLYPTYLVALSIFMVPIAIGGLTTIGRQASPDTYMITLPISAGADGMSLVAFIGGLSAATGMVIVAAVSLATMLCNDVFMPLYMRLRRAGASTTADMTHTLLFVRRAAVLVVLLLAFVTHRVVDREFPLTIIGLVSFVAVAQFGPAFFLGLYWRRANRAAAFAGLATGFAVWTYTLLLPSLAPVVSRPGGWLERGPWDIAWLRPQALFGIDNLDPISHATLWSLGFNLLVFVIVSLIARQSAVERVQAEAFSGGGAAAASKGPWRAIARLDDLRVLAMRFVGAERGGIAFDDYLARRRAGDGPPLDASSFVDWDAIRFTEHLISGAIGAASARVVMAASLEGHSLSRSAAMAMLDEASEALHVSRKVLEGALESVPQGICVFDGELRIVAWNHRFLELLALPKELVRVGIPLRELVAFNSTRGEYGALDPSNLLINRDLETQTWPYIYERKRPDGTVLEISNDRMPDGGLVATYTDVTERYRAAEILREANEGLEERVKERTLALEAAKAQAEQANLSKTRFLAAASHDLLQPLNAARLFVSALDESLRQSSGHSRIGDPAPDKNLRLTANAAAALHATEQLLDGLLDISSLDSGAVRAEIETLKVADILEPLRISFSALAQERGLALDFVPSTAAIRSDPRLLRRILQNLISNAIRYTPNGRVLVGCRRRGDALSIEVWDTGIGISSASLQEIFEEFRRLSPEGTNDKGLGLGLAIVDRMSKLLGHRVDVVSEPGRGTGFKVLVPLAPSPGVASLVPARARPTRRAGPSAGGALTVLCIDNEAAILDGLSALIGEWGHRVRIAGDPDAALAQALADVPDVILADFHLGAEESGLDVIRRLRQALRTELPALLITADRSEEVRRMAAEADCTIMVKPVKPAALRRFLTGAALRRPERVEDDVA